MNRLVSVRTEELAGPALDWVINEIESEHHPVAGQLDLFTLPDAEQLIEKYGVWVDVGHRYPWLADATNDPFNRQPGETRIIAVFRAVVFAKRGATVKVPADLVQALPQLNKLPMGNAAYYAHVLSDGITTELFDQRPLPNE